MNSKHLAALALAVAGLAGTGLAQAHGGVDVQWSVNIGGPLRVQLPLPFPVIVPRAPVVVVAPPPPVRVYETYPAYPAYPVYRRAGWGDADRDGIPDRYDRVYNPRWDRDGDGIPNRWDRHDDRRDDRREDRRDEHRDDRGPQRWRGER